MIRIRGDRRDVSIRPDPSIKCEGAGVSARGEAAMIPEVDP
jgi:hypothetical protein